MKGAPRSPGDFVRAPLSGARMQRMWDGVATAEERLRRRRRRARGATVLVFATSVAAATLLFVRHRAPAAGGAPTAPLVVDTETAAREVSLPDGTSLALGASTHVDVVAATEGEIHVRVARGAIAFDVPARTARRLVVEANDVEVDAKEGRFSMSVQAGGEDAGTAVSVRVEAGAAEVRDRDHHVIAFLGPGQRWTSEADANRPIDPPPEDVAPSPTAPSPSSSSAVTPQGSAPSSARSASGARALFEQADAARLAGRPADAASALDQLRQRYPRDPRAGYAAFELGRIRLESLHDPRGAADAFAFALAHPGPGFFRDDAQAGRIAALAAAGDKAACVRARDAFLAKQPNSAQAPRVAKLCEDP